MVAGERFIAELPGVIIRRQPTLSSDKAGRPAVARCWRVGESMSKATSELRAHPGWQHAAAALETSEAALVRWTRRATAFGPFVQPVRSLHPPSSERFRDTNRGISLGTFDPPREDIIFHFAVEDYLMNFAKITSPLLYLWRPQPVVTIGRHQNPWKECVLEQLQSDQVALAFDIDRNLETVLGGLRRLGVAAEKKGRNDLVYQGKKISGSAFKHAPDRQVMNLREAFPSLTHQDLCDALTEEFRDREGANRKDLMAELGDKSWRFGKTPEFSHQFETRIDGVGVFDVHLKVVHGVIEDATIFSDALFPDVISAAMTSLCGVEYGFRFFNGAAWWLTTASHCCRPLLYHGYQLRSSLSARMEVIEITKEDLLKEDDQDLLEEEKEPLGHDPSERRDMEAQLREVLTPTPELLERVHRAEAAAARTFHTGQRQSLGELLAQNQHLAQMAGLSHWEDFPWRPKADEAGQDASLPARHVRRRRESAACANQVQDLYSGWADAASPHWRYQSSSPSVWRPKSAQVPAFQPVAGQRGDQWSQEAERSPRGPRPRAVERTLHRGRRGASHLAAGGDAPGDCSGKDDG
eukprot:g24084.t1